jgi:hypothetical protein
VTNTNILIRTALAVLLTFALVIAITQIAGISLRQMVVEIVVYCLYGMLVLAYALRFVLVFLGVFAVYKILQERHARMLAA